MMIQIIKYILYQIFAIGTVTWAAYVGVNKMKEYKEDKDVSYTVKEEVKSLPLNIYELKLKEYLEHIWGDNDFDDDIVGVHKLVKDTIVKDDLLATHLSKRINTWIGFDSLRLDRYLTEYKQEKSDELLWKIDSLDQKITDRQHFLKTLKRKTPDKVRMVILETEWHDVLKITTGIARDTLFLTKRYTQLKSIKHYGRPN